MNTTFLNNTSDINILIIGIGIGLTFSLGTYLIKSIWFNSNDNTMIIIENKTKGIKFVEIEEQSIQTEALKVVEKIVQTEPVKNISDTSSTTSSDTVTSYDSITQQFSPITRFSEIPSPIENNVATQTDSLQFINQSTQTSINHINQSTQTSINHVDQIIQAIPNVSNVNTQTITDLKNIGIQAWPNLSDIGTQVNTLNSIQPVTEVKSTLVQTDILDNYSERLSQIITDVSSQNSPSEYNSFSSPSEYNSFPSPSLSNISDRISEADSILPIRPYDPLFIRNIEPLFIRNNEIKTVSEINQIYLNKIKEINELYAQEIYDNALTGSDIIRIIHNYSVDQLVSSNINDTILMIINCFNG